MDPVLLGVLLVVAAGGVVIGVLARLVRQRPAGRESFPPISDAEFLARCSPGTRPEVALKVRRIVADTLGVEYERVHPSGRFVEDFAAD